MGKIVGLSFFWVLADIGASFLPPDAAEWLWAVVTVVVLAGLGSIVLSAILGGDGFSHLFAGFMLAVPGVIITRLGFGWRLANPTTICRSLGSASCGFGDIVLAMLLDLLIVAVGMAIVALPALPVIWKLHRPQ